MALTPEQLAEIQRLKALMQQPATDAQRKAQAIWNAEQMSKPQGKAKGGLAKFLEPSKVKQRMYHGTSQDIKEFEPRQANSVFVTDSPDTAHFFAKNSDESKHNREKNPEGGGQNIMPVHVQVSNPFDFEDKEHMKALREYEKANRYTDRSISHHIGSVNGGDWEAIEHKKVQDALKHLGHDAFYVRENGRKNLGIHDPRKIKSAIGNRGTYDTNEHDITKAEGGTVNAFDYENPEHVSSVAGHVAKHKDFKAYDPKLMGEVLSTGNYKHIEDPRILGAIKKAGFGGYHTLEKTGKKLTPFVVKKAMGGAVQPSLDEMKTALIKKAKPDFNDMRNIGVNEAPGLDIKAFVSPSRDGQAPFPVGGVSMGDKPLPMGGVDMNKGQPGNQLMPANMAQPAPQGQPGQPPQGAPSPLGGAGAPPPPQGGSNILQMTPQGQAMAAMKPPGMAEGGGITSLSQLSGTTGSPSVPQLAQGGLDPHPLPVVMKEGGSDNRPPVSNQNMDNGATNYSIDNFQQLAKGGKVEKSLHYEPSPVLKQSDIEAMAERMTRQMQGVDNPNQKTLQQIAREKDLPVGIKGSKKMDVPVINYEDLKGSYSVGVPGDTSRGGVKPTKGKSMGAPKAGEYLESIGGEKLDKPVGMYGGKDYGAFGHPEGWASDLGASAGMFNVVKKLAEENPEREVYGHYHKMSPEALNHAVHMLDAVISHHKPHASPMERIAMLNRLMREETTTTSKHDVPYPEFPGFENPADIMLHGQMNSGMRKKIIGLLGKEKYFPGGKQKLDDIIYAISHPELRNIETGAGGSSIIKFDPSRSLKESISPHPTYGHDIPSRLVGKTKYITPAELLAPRSMANAKREIAAMGKKVVPFNQAKMNIIREPIDEQFINQMGEYEQAMKKRLGYKKGGTVKFRDDMDTINLELSIKRKKAK